MTEDPDRWYLDNVARLFGFKSADELQPDETQQILELKRNGSTIYHAAAWMRGLMKSRF
jgi:hypothetical protein